MHILDVADASQTGHMHGHERRGLAAFVTQIEPAVGNPVREWTKTGFTANGAFNESHARQREVTWHTLSGVTASSLGSPYTESCDVTLGKNTSHKHFSN
jgi:glucuronate isomerase